MILGMVVPTRGSGVRVGGLRSVRMTMAAATAAVLGSRTGTRTAAAAAARIVAVIEFFVHD